MHTLGETDSATTAQDLDRKLVLLRAQLQQLGSVLVCFSGGLDSSFLLAVAKEVLGSRVVALTAAGPALAPSELEEARAFARRIAVQHEVADAGEMTVPGYVANGPDRCFHCKSSLYALANAMRARLGLSHVINGTNVDDLTDYRPGLDAARMAAVHSPLVDASMSKADVREAARLMGLTLWDKPAAACLASRIPYGTEVTVERLGQVAALEAALRGLGVGRVRVRHHESVARIEVDAQRIAQVASSPMREAVWEAGRRVGYRYVTLDLGGYRMGSLNDELRSGRS